MISERYFKVAAIHKKLHRAERQGKVLYISGGVGMGKTEAVRYYFRRKPHTVLSGKNYMLDRMPAEAELGEDALIFDDISRITDAASMDYILDKVYRTDRHVVLIGRGLLPLWLERASTDRHIVFAFNEDLEIGMEGIRELCLLEGLDLPPETVRDIWEDSFGNSLFICRLLEAVEEFGSYSERARAKAERSVRRYLDQTFFSRISRTLQEILLLLSEFDTFSIRMAQMVTGRRNIRLYIEQMFSIGDFIIERAEGEYNHRPFYQMYMDWKREMSLPEEEARESIQRAALYYELEEQYVEALNCYRRIRDDDRILSLLCRMTEEQPGMERSLHEILPYYESVPQATIRRHPVLMAGMSMVCSQAMRLEESERWYRELQAFEKGARHDSPEQIEARYRLALLDIILPHRSSRNLPEAMERMRHVSHAWNGGGEEISTSDFYWSILNGGKDLCEIAPLLNNEKIFRRGVLSISASLGEPNGKAVELGMLEYRFEADNIDAYKLTAGLNDVYLYADRTDDIELAFVALGIQVRHHLCHGDRATAESLYESFKRKLERTDKEKARWVRDNTMGLMHIQMAMRGGELAAAKKWLETAPDTTVFFTILDRYKLLIKARILVALGRDEEALLLLERLRSIFENYNRIYLWIQVQLLIAPILYRQKEADWRTVLQSALEKAHKFGFCRVVSMEGVSIKPLLDEMLAGLDKGEPFEGISAEYLEKVSRQTDKMALYYPNYLRPVGVHAAEFTEMEENVLRFLCGEMESREICDRLHLSYSGLKFHKHNIYRKLGARNVHEAVRKARALGFS